MTDLTTTAQKDTLHELKKKAFRLGGTIFELETREDGGILISDGQNTMVVDTDGNLNREGA